MNHNKQDKRNRLMAAAVLCAAFCIFVLIQGAIHLDRVPQHDLTCYAGPFVAAISLSGCVGFLSFQFFKRKK